MYNVARLSDKDRDVIFTRYAFEYGNNKSIIEKDFWVTLVLDYLFHKCRYKDYFIFKGGTSLSKCFSIINRFSEDIDLILRWDLLTDDNESGILKYIRLEIGPLAALTPTEDIEISPLIASLNLKIYDNVKTVIKTVSPERTFWEKIMILHQEANRPMDKKMPSRYSRHYYDVYKISLTKYKDNACSNLELLEKVRNFKKKFYPVSWAKYDTAVPGKFILVPSNNRIKELKDDFNKMKEMINDDSITFEQLMMEIKKIEDEINNLK